MAQHDYTIANQSFPNTRSDLNNSLSAIVSNNSGATAPSTTYAYQWWYDETTDTLKMRNSDNDAWISMFTFNQTADTYSATISGDLTVDTDTLKVDAANNRVGIGLTNPACQLDIRQDGTGSLTKRVQANIDLSGSTNLLSTDPTLFVQQSGTGSAGLAVKSGSVEFTLRLDSSGNFIFDKETTERIRIDASTGSAIIPNGVTLGTAAGTYNAANNLDDYEEGTYTASMSASSSGTITSTSTLRYTKIGRIVHVYGRVDVTAASSPTGNARIALPFVVAGGSAFGIGYVRNGVNDMADYSISTNSIGTSQVNVYVFSGTTRVFNQAPDFSGDEEIHFALTYETS